MKRLDESRPLLLVLAEEGVDDHLGTPEEGKHADLLVLKRDPRKDISRVWRSLEKIMLNGAWLT